MISIFSSFGQIFADNISDHPKGGKIIALFGIVTADGNPAAEGMAVKNGTIIRTGEKASCEIIFNEKNW